MLYYLIFISYQRLCLLPSNHKHRTAGLWLTTWRHSLL